MKRLLTFALAILMIFSLVACSNSNEKGQGETTSVLRTYQKLTYTDFNNFATEKGYSPVENTDNSQLTFKRSFGIEKDNGFNVLFYEVEDVTAAYTYYSYVLQTYEAYVAEFSSSTRYNNFGCYILKDDAATVYIAFVDNTLVYSLLYEEDDTKHAELRKELVEFIQFLDYPMMEIPEFTK